MSIELVILLPALFAVMFLGMQAALFYHARTVAIAAAQEGARAAGARERATRPTASLPPTRSSADAGGDDVLVGRSDDVCQRTATTVTVTVKATA